MNQRGFPKGVQEKLRSDFQDTRRGQSRVQITFRSRELFYGREAISSFSVGLMQYLAASDKFLEGL